MSSDGAADTPRGTQEDNPSVDAAAAVRDHTTAGNGMADNNEEEAALKLLTANVRDQDDLERDISHQANLALIESEDKKDEKRIERAQLNIQKLEAQKKTQQERFRKAIGKPDVKDKIRRKIARLDAEIDISDKDIADFHARIEKRNQESGDGNILALGSSKKLPNESHREFLIRTGKITPFANVGGPRSAEVEGELANALVDAEDEAAAEELEESGAFEPRSHQNLRAPGFAEEPEAPATGVESEFSLRPRKRRKLVPKGGDSSDGDYAPRRSAAARAAPEADFVDDEDDEESEGYDLTERTRKKPTTTKGDEKIDLSKIDDGNEAVYQSRLADWVERRSRARRMRHQGSPRDDDQPEWFNPSPDEPDHHLQDGLKLPGDIYPALFDYQKTGVQWLAELYAQKVGGIVGDEMGLGESTTRSVNAIEKS